MHYIGREGYTITSISQNKLIIIVSLVFTLFYNYTFFTNTISTYPLVAENYGFLFSLVVVFFSIIALLFTLVSSKFTTKPLLIITLLVSSMAAYFMDTYHVVVDENMIRNTLQTDIKESLDLLSIKQVLYFIFLGVLPAYAVFKTPIVYNKRFRSALWNKLKQVLLLIILITVSLFVFSKHYTSFAREHKPLRYSANPLYWIYSIGKYTHKTFNSGPIVIKSIGLDAKIIKENNDTLPKLVILVVGEAARADHFSLNGYNKETNPLLKKENILNFPNVSSCGTSTAESVPCMFSIYDKESYSYKKGISTENVLDVLKHTNHVSLLWRDNNSDSKGVALRIPYEYYKSPVNNPVCQDGECRDEGMLIGLPKYIKAQKNKDILIVLHQMGNHGPAYYKRYPKDYETFTPVCKTNQLEKCTKEEISNAYDNALRYTDSFLEKTIALLKHYNATHQTALLYMSDHGESLGEKGVYLHGLPYVVAPDAQTHIGAFIWIDKKHQASFGDIDTNKHYSQDNLFHTLLGLFNVHTEVYNKKMDILREHQ